MRLVQITQRAVDLDRACEFYSRLLHAEPKYRDDAVGRAFFELDSGVRLMLSLGAEPALFLLQVDNAHEAIETLGVPVVTKPQITFPHDSDNPGPGGYDEWQTFIEDTEGNTIGLVAHQRP